MTIPASGQLPGTRPCPRCGCCQFGLCLIASRNMDECHTMATDPAGTRACPCSAVLRRPLVSVVPHVWDAGSATPRCLRCGAAGLAATFPNCWYHPHEPDRDRTCKWCGLVPSDPDAPLDCPGMPRVMHVTAWGTFLAQALYFAVGDQDAGP